MTIGLVEKVVYLLAHLFAGLARQKLITLHNAGIVRLESGSLAGGAERVKNLVAPNHILGIEIPHSAGCFKAYFFCHV